MRTPAIQSAHFITTTSLQAFNTACWRMIRTRKAIHSPRIWSAGLSHGVLFLHADGTFQYAPYQNYNGVDSFTYKANDGTSDSATVKVTINIAAVNDLPTFVGGPSLEIPQGSGPQTVKNWAKKISAGGPDEASQPLEFQLIFDSDPSLFDVEPQIDAKTGTLTYTPKKGVYGNASLNVVLVESDPNSDATVSSDTDQFNIQIDHVNHKPVAKDDAFTTPVNTSLVVTPIAPQISLYLVDQDGAHTYTQANGDFSYSINSNEVDIQFKPFGSEDSSNFEFDAPGEQNLLPGIYSDAFSDDGPGQAHIFLSDVGDSDTAQSGEFTVLQIRDFGDTERFAANFDDSQDGDPDTEVRGTIKINYAPAAGVLANDSDVDNDNLTTKIESPTRATAR